MLDNVYFTTYVYVYIALLAVFFWQLTKFQRYFGVLRPTLQTLQTEIIPKYGDTLGGINRLSPELEEKRVTLYERFYTNYSDLCQGTKTPTVVGILMFMWSVVFLLADYFANTFYLKLDIGLAMMVVSILMIVMSVKLITSWEDFAYKYKREFDSYSAVVYSS